LLTKDPSQTVLLFDLDRGTKETVRLKGGKLEIAAVPGFVPLPMVDSDYRIMNTVTNELAPLSNKGIPNAPPFDKRVYVAYCPHITKVGTGTVKLADWAKWLKKNKKLGFPNLGLGIEHVYADIEVIGRKRPGCLAEFHLLGHAGSSHNEASGAAFVNTWEWRTSPHGLSMKADRRSQLDLDARANVDFRTRSSNFAKAFGADAFSQVWGCNWHRPSHAIVTQIVLKRGTKKLTDAETFTIKIDYTELKPDEFEKLFTKPFEHSRSKPVKLAPGSFDAKKIEWKGLTGRWVRDYLAALIDRTYMKALARASKRPVLGGLPTTYSDYDVKAEGGWPLLAHIPMGTGRYTNDPNAVNFSKTLEFYEATFGVKFGRGAHPRFGRGFAWYDP
jgi:hypothetical protein